MIRRTEHGNDGMGVPRFRAAAEMTILPTNQTELSGIGARAAT